MTLEDDNKQTLFNSINPPKYEFSIINQCEDNELLTKIFIAYHIKIPMECIGE
jgi:hypothetical protein